MLQKMIKNVKAQISCNIHILVELEVHSLNQLTERTFNRLSFSKAVEKPAVKFHNIDIMSPTKQQLSSVCTNEKKLKYDIFYLSHRSML